MAEGGSLGIVSLVLLLVSSGIVTRGQESTAYLPYQFQYSIDHPEGGQSSRVEKGDQNAVTGSYQITTVDGFKRVVNYVADGSGFRAFVDSNEPGVKSGEYPPPDNSAKEFTPDRYKPNTVPAPAAPAATARELPILGYRKIEHVHETPLYQEAPVRTPGRPVYQEFIPQEFSPLRPLHVVTNGHAGSSFSQRQGRKLESNIEAISPVLTLKPDPREERGLPQQEPVSEQVAHSPTLYFNTPNKEEEGGAIITKNNLNPPVKIFPPGSGIAQQGRPFQPSVPQIQTHHPKNYPVHSPGELLSVDVQPVNKRLGDVKGEYYLRGHDGQLRKVVYEADKDGFRARVDTNEFGIISHKPNNATITRTGKLPQFHSFGAPENVFKPERPLERPPRPSIYVGQDLLINNKYNGDFAEPEIPRRPQPALLPAPVAGGDRRPNEPQKFDSRKKPVNPIDTLTDLKQRPENFDIVEPLPPHSIQRVHPASSPRQTFTPVNTFEQKPQDYSDAYRGNQNPQAPRAPATPKVRQPDQDRINQVQQQRVTTNRPNIYSQLPASPESHSDRSGVGNERLPDDRDARGFRNPSLNGPERFRQPNFNTQRNEYRQPHHGPGFGYQFSTSHEQDVNPPPPRFYRLENPPLAPQTTPPLAPQRIPSLAPQRTPPLSPQRTPPQDLPSYPPRSQSPSLNFDVGSQVGPNRNERVAVQPGNRLSFRPPQQRTPQDDSRRGRFLEPAVVIEEDVSDPQKMSRGSFDGTYQPLRRDEPRARVVPPQARAFGRPASPNLKSPASEALKSDLGATVSLAPIKQFGPPAATPLPSHFQSVEDNSTEPYETTPTPFARQDPQSTRSPKAARTGKSSPLLRMYDNGVVIGGPEPQKISYDPINDNPVRQGRKFDDQGHHSGYAPRNFGPVYYNNADQANHYSNFAETSEPDRNARLVHEIVTHNIELPKAGLTVTTSSPLEPTAFSPADNANLMSFAVRKVSRRRRRKQRPTERVEDLATTETPEPEFISRSTPLPSHRPLRLPHQRVNPPPASSPTKQTRSGYNERIPFGARLRPQENYLPRPRDITINSPRSLRVTTADPELNNFSSPNTEAPPLRKIVRRRRLKNRVQNNEDVYPNIPRTPPPADLGFRQGVPSIQGSHTRLPHLPSGADLPARRRQKLVTSTSAASDEPTTTDSPDDSAVDLKQSTSRSSSDPPSQAPQSSFSPSTKPHLPGLPPPSTDAPNVSFVSLIDQPATVPRSQSTQSSYRSHDSSQNAENESRLYNEPSEQQAPETQDHTTSRTAKQLSLPRLQTNDRSSQYDLQRPISVFSPYRFGFDDRHDGGRIARHEEFDGSGRVTGFYTIEDPDGRRRLVKYVADENGFRAQVLTNEQGTDNQDPAQIRVYSTSPHYVPQQIDFRPLPLLP